jgi:type I restriction enzyme S subunit
VSSKWPRAALGEIFAIARGGSPRPIDDYLTEDPNGVNWVMISDATESGKYVNSTKKRIRAEGVKRSRTVQPGDFLLTNSMSFGRPYIMNTSGCIHDGWLVLSPRNKNASPDFFYHLLGSDFVFAEFERRAAGATVKNLNIDLVKTVEVPLPPLAEQRRIADVLDRAEGLRAKRRTALAQLESLPQSLFLDLFGDPASNPKGWPMKQLGDVATELYRYPTYYDITYEDGGVPEIRGELLNSDGSIVTDRTRLRFISAKTSARFPKTVLATGDLVMSVRGTIGKIGLVPPELAGGQITANLIRIALDQAKLDPLFAWNVTQTPFFKGQIAGACSSTTILTIKAPDLKRLPFPLPPITLQREFARRVKAVEALNTAQRASLAELDALFVSLQHRAFRGEL